MHRTSSLLVRRLPAEREFVRPENLASRPRPGGLPAAGGVALPHVIAHLPALDLIDLIGGFGIHNSTLSPPTCSAGSINRLPLADTATPICIASAARQSPTIENRKSPWLPGLAVADPATHQFHSGVRYIAPAPYLSAVYPLNASSSGRKT